MKEKISHYYYQIDECHKEIAVIYIDAPWKKRAKVVVVGVCGNAFRSRVSFGRSTGSLRSSEFPTWSSSFLRTIENWVSPLSATIQDKWHKGGSKRVRRATYPLRWLDETRTCCGIDMSVVPFQFGIPDQYRWLGLQTEVHHHLRTRDREDAENFLKIRICESFRKFMFLAIVSYPRRSCGIKTVTRNIS